MNLTKIRIFPSRFVEGDEGDEVDTNSIVARLGFYGLTELRWALIHINRGVLNLGIMRLTVKSSVFAQDLRRKTPVRAHSRRIKHVMKQTDNLTSLLIADRHLVSVQPAPSFTIRHYNT